MTIIKKYLYIGENGTMFSTVLIPGASAQTWVTLVADSGKILTNGTARQLAVTVPETQSHLWKEVDAMVEDFKQE